MPLAVLVLLALVSMPLSAAAKSTPYSLAPAPFSGQMPDGWVTKKQTAHLTTFHAPAGTAEAEASVWIRVAPMVQQPEWTIEDYLEDLQRAMPSSMEFSGRRLNRNGPRAAAKS